MGSKDTVGFTGVKQHPIYSQSTTQQRKQGERGSADTRGGGAGGGGWGSREI